MPASNLRENFTELLNTTVNVATGRRCTSQELAAESRRRVESASAVVRWRRQLSHIYLWELLHSNRLEDLWPAHREAFEMLAEILGVELQDLAGTDYERVQSGWPVPAGRAAG